MRKRTSFFAAVLAFGVASTQAYAASSTVITFTGTCDVGSITPQHGQKGVFAYLEAKNQGSCQNIDSAGLQGKASISSINGQWIFIPFLSSDSPGDGLMLAVQYPLKNGNTYLLYGSQNGKKAGLIISGNYAIGPGADAPAKDAPELQHAH